MTGLVVLLAAIVLAAPGDRAARGYGISLRLPEGWSGAVTQAPHPAALPVLRVRGPGGIEVVLSEVGNRPGTSGFIRVRLPVRVRHERQRLAISGRAFVLEVRSPRLSAKVFADATAALASLDVRPRFVLTPTLRRKLARPAAFPLIRPGRRCPRSPTGRRAPNVGVTLGRGPAYPVVGAAGVARLDPRSKRLRRYAHKTLWAVSPSYRGPVLVRGRQLDGDAALRFQFGRRSMLFPGLAPWERRGWRYIPTSTLIPAPGCYAFRVDGTSFSRTLVFRATL